MKAFIGRLMWGRPSPSFFDWRIILAPKILSAFLKSKREKKEEEKEEKRGKKLVTEKEEDEKCLN